LAVVEKAAMEKSAKQKTEMEEAGLFYHHPTLEEDRINMEMYLTMLRLCEEEGIVSETLWHAIKGIEPLFSSQTSLTSDFQLFKWLMEKELEISQLLFGPDHNLTKFATTKIKHVDNPYYMQFRSSCVRNDWYESF
jgi:hypothetical protein